MAFAVYFGLGLFLLPVSVRAQILTGYGDAETVDEKALENSNPSSSGHYQPFLTMQAPDSQSVSAETDIEIYTEDMLSNHVESVPPSQDSSVPQTFEDTVADSLSFASQDNPQEVNLEADTMSYDETGQIITASGDVIIEQEGRILRADTAEYHVKADTVSAQGNVVLNEPNGDIHLSESVHFSNKLQTGDVQNLYSELADGSYFSAQKGRLEQVSAVASDDDSISDDGERAKALHQRVVMEDATYTACEPCKSNPSKPPTWQIKASEVVHDEDEARVEYKHARFNVYGVPIVYTPYFSHADGSIDRKSGFLSPSLGYKSDLGAFIENQFYWNIAPDKDATFGLLAMTQQAPLGLVEYRQRWDDAGLELKGGVTSSDRHDNQAGRNVVQEDEFRGHIFAKGQWDMNHLWRSGIDVEYVSDDQYARQYDITDEDVLTNDIYLERFEGRNYAKGLLQMFQDIRTSDLQDDQPGVLPEITASFIGEPGEIPFVKGRWDANVGVLSLFRDGAEQDVVRGSADVGWKRRLFSDYGLVSDLDLRMRGDLYSVHDADAAQFPNATGESFSEARFFPQAHMQSAYPMVKEFEQSNMQMSLEPLVALTVAPKNDDADMTPNEDSQDVQLDASNLFKANRFPGLDGIEDESRVTYGVRTGLNRFGGQGNGENLDAEFFIGQSYRFEKDHNPFESGSGLSHRNSDFVGYFKGSYRNQYSMQYRYQLNNENLSPERHELDIYADWNRFRLSSSYLYAIALDGTEIDENREQIFNSGQYYFNDSWRLSFGSTYDLGADPGLRTGMLALDYFGQCVSWGIEAQKNLTDDSSGESDTEILIRIGLKNISEFTRSGLRKEDG